jgi:hypothetical protein
MEYLLIAGLFGLFLWGVWKWTGSDYHIHSDPKTRGLEQATLTRQSNHQQPIGYSDYTPGYSGNGQAIRDDESEARGERYSQKTEQRRIERQQGQERITSAEAHRRASAEQQRIMGLKTDDDRRHQRAADDLLDSFVGRN